MMAIEWCDHCGKIKWADHRCPPRFRYRIGFDENVSSIDMEDMDFVIHAMEPKEAAERAVEQACYQLDLHLDEHDDIAVRIEGQDGTVTFWKVRYEMEPTFYSERIVEEDEDAEEH